MSRDGSTILEWADGTNSFRFAWGDIEMLQEELDCSPFEVLDRLLKRRCRIGDISHTIRIGLIGGGLTPAEALTMVRHYVEKRPPGESIPIAAVILHNGLFGAKDEEPGEAEGEATDSGSMTSPAESSASA